MSDDTMIERLARAIWEDWRGCKTATEAARETSWELLVKGAKTRPAIQDIVDDAYSQVRAVLQELREPTQAVLDAGDNVGRVHEYRPDDGNWFDYETHDPKEVWQAMLDHILSQ